MNRLVFWKILIGFWITSLLITQGVWLMFTVLRPMPQTDVPTSTLDIAVTAASAIIEQRGEAAFLQEFGTWPSCLRAQIEVRPAAANGNASTIVPSREGRRYRIITHPQPCHREHQHGPLDVPWEVLLVSFAGGLGFSAILAWYLTAPVQRIRGGFDRLARGEFSTRLGASVGRRRDEIADLARDFDIMAKRLEELAQARDRLLAGVSHELRSPLARLQLATALARQDPAKVGASLERIDREAERLDEVVGELLTLSKLESGVPHSEDYFDFAEVVKLVAEDAKFEATPMGVAVFVEIHSPDTSHEWIALGSGKLVSRAVENIVRNAIRFSTRGQEVRVVLDQEPPGMFRLTITDQGPGVSDSLLRNLFKPFVQGTGDGHGFGLGLAIAERAVVAHGGTISAGNEPTGGLIISVCIPTAKVDQHQPEKM